MADRKPTRLDFGREPDFDQILTNPFLDIAARIWEVPRYAAFQVCYRSMRLIDDLVDDRRAEDTAISADEVTHLRSVILGWLESLAGRTATEGCPADLISALDSFAIPIWPWERLCSAMIYDLEHEGFRNFRVFLRYAEGAAIAPASVFVHLCGVREGEDDRYRPPRFDIRKTARPLALFSYLVHIVRDFQKDHRRGLNYFAEDLLLRSALSPADLRLVVEGGAIPEALRELIHQYKTLADHYRSKARRTLDTLAPQL